MLLVIWTVVLVGIISIVAFSNWKMRRAWRWWVSQETQHRVAWADQIQNGLVQDLFALRLSLQPLSAEKSATQNFTAQLTAAENLHRCLDDLSTALFSPCLPHSLPLALRTQLQQWQTAHPCDLQLNLPVDWPQESLERSQIVLTTLDRLLLLTEVPVTSLTVRLEQQQGRARLTIERTHAALAETALQMTPHAQELKYLRRCFRCLMPGRCDYRIGAQTMNWQLSWRLIPVDGDKSDDF